MSSLARRIERIEQSPPVQREQRCLLALTTHDYSTLTDDDLTYLDAAYRKEYGEAWCNHVDAWFAALSDAEVKAIAEERWTDLNAQTRAEWDALCEEAEVKADGQSRAQA